MPCSAANETARTMRSSIVSRSTPSAASFRSEIGDSITLAPTPSSTSAFTSASTARENAQPSAPLPVRAGLDREHHSLFDGAAGGLVGERRLVCARADAVCDRMRGLVEPRVDDAGPDQAVELCEAGTWPAVVDRAVVHAQEC